METNLLFNASASGLEAGAQGHIHHDKSTPSFLFGQVVTDTTSYIIDVFLTLLLF